MCNISWIAEAARVVVSECSTDCFSSSFAVWCRISSSLEALLAVNSFRTLSGEYCGSVEPAAVPPSKARHAVLKSSPPPDGGPLAAAVCRSRILGCRYQHLVTIGAFENVTYGDSLRRCSDGYCEVWCRRNDTHYHIRSIGFFDVVTTGEPDESPVFHRIYLVC